MNLLYLCDEYPPSPHGGIGSVIQNLAREMVSKGHQVFVCGFYPYYRPGLTFEVDCGVNVHRCFYGNWLLLKLSRHKYLGRIINIENSFKSYIKFLKELIVEKKIEIIEIPDFNEAFRYSGPRNIGFPDFGIPKVVKLHGSYSYLDHSKTAWSFERQIFLKEKHLLESATKVVAVSNFASNITRDIFEYDKGIKIIHNGITIKHQISYKEITNKNTVIFAGRISEEKGVISLIKAWELVVKEISGVKLMLYGKGDKKTLEEINTIIPREIRNSVELKGFVSGNELIDVYNTASCAIFPSYFESFGMAPMEAMLAGCPTIYTNRTSGDELITHEENGILINPENISEIANAILCILRDRPAALKLGENGAKTVREKFNISTIVDDHLKFYSSLK